MTSYTFNAQDHTPADGGSQALPKGWYVAMITESAIKPTKDTLGLRLNLTYQVTEGFAIGSIFYGGINIKNANPVAEKIANEQLSGICHAVQQYQISEGATSVLHNIPHNVKLKFIEAAGQYEAKNEPTGFKHISEKVMYAQPDPTVATASPQQAPQQAPPQQAPQQAPPQQQQQQQQQPPAQQQQQPPQQQQQAPPQQQQPPVQQQQQQQPPAQQQPPVQQQQQQQQAPPMQQQQQQQQQQAPVQQQQQPPVQQQQQPPQQQQAPVQQQQAAPDWSQAAQQPWQAEQGGQPAQTQATTTVDNTPGPNQEERPPWQS